MLVTKQPRPHAVDYTALSALWHYYSPPIAPQSASGQRRRRPRPPPGPAPPSPPRYTPPQTTMRRALLPRASVWALRDTYCESPRPVELRALLTAVQSSSRPSSRGPALFRRHAGGGRSMTTLRLICPAAPCFPMVYRPGMFGGGRVPPHMPLH